MWDADPKAAESLEGRVPCLDALRKFICTKDLLSLKVPTAGAPDGRTLQRMWEANVCICGQAEPSRHHLTFHCPRALWEAELASPTERALLLRLLRPPEPRCDPPDGLDEELVSFLREAADAGIKPVLSLDGGCLTAAGAEPWQRASWAVVAWIPGSTLTIGGLVSGGEQTAAAGERAALHQAITHAAAAHCAVDLLLDCRPLVSRLERGMLHDSWTGDLPAYWASVQASVLPGSRVAWVPSHGKQRDWNPPQGWPCASLLRDLNAQADARCNEALQSCREVWNSACAARLSAIAWSEAACKKQYQATCEHQQRMFELSIAGDPP